MRAKKEGSEKSIILKSAQLPDVWHGAGRGNS